MQRLQAEVRALTKEQLRLEVLSHLPFMAACLSEGLRVYPPAPIPLFRATPKSGNVICGEFIPEHVRGRFLRHQTTQSCTLTAAN
jgi:hypothetical protein